MATWDITTAGSRFTISTTALSASSVIKVDTNHFWALYTDNGTNKVIQTLLEVNTSTWAVTTKSTNNLSTTTTNNVASMTTIDSTHALGIFTYRPSSNYTGYAQVLAVNTSTWAVTTSAASLNFNTGSITQNVQTVAIDTNHFISVFYENAVGNRAQVFTVNTSTWAVTTSSAVFTYNSSGQNAAIVKIDTNHFATVGYNPGAGKTEVQVLAVNTSTWAVTTAGAVFQDTNTGLNYSVYIIDSTHFVSFFNTQSGAGNRQYGQVYTVNTSTWAVTTSSAALDIGTNYYSNDYDNYRVALVDTNHFILYWPNYNAYQGFTQIIEVNTSTFALTKQGTAFNYTAGAYGVSYSSCVQMDSSHTLNLFYDNTVNYALYAQVFSTVLPPTTSIKTIDGLAYASVKTVDGLAIASVKTFNGLA